MNALAAAAVGYRLGTDFEAIVGGLEEQRRERQVEVVPGMRVFIWAAMPTRQKPKGHFGDSQGMAKGRVIVVFGCGGDRDRGWPIMGRVAGDICDLVIH